MRRLGTIVALGCLLAVAATQPVAAASKVSAMPGEVRVALDPYTTHSVIVEDSVEEKSPAPVEFLAGGVIGASSGAIAVANALPAVEAAIVAPMPWWAIALQAAVIGGLIKLRSDLEAEGRERYEPKHVVTITELEGHPLTVDSFSSKFCREEVRAANSKGVIPNAVSCEVLPSGTDSDLLPDAHPIDQNQYRFATPALFVVGGSEHRNRVAVKQHFASTFRSRVVWGGVEDDVLIGSRFADELIGLPGNDRIYGGPGDDWLMGLQGHGYADAIIGDAGGEMDQWDSTRDDDTIFGGAGSDVAWGYAGNDRIFGGAGSDDRVVRLDDPSGALGGSGGFVSAPALFGGAGDDVVVGGSGSDRLAGGKGRDMILARESDFGEPDEPDLGGDCGPNLGTAPGRERFRVSRLPDGTPMESIVNCDFELPDAPPWSALFP